MSAHTDTHTHTQTHTPTVMTRLFQAGGARRSHLFCVCAAVGGGGAWGGGARLPGLAGARASGGAAGRRIMVGGAHRPAVPRARRLIQHRKPWNPKTGCHHISWLYCPLCHLLVHDTCVWYSCIYIYIFHIYISRRQMEIELQAARAAGDGRKQQPLFTCARRGTRGGGWNRNRSSHEL